MILLSFLTMQAMIKLSELTGDRVFDYSGIELAFFELNFFRLFVWINWRNVWIQERFSILDCLRPRTEEITFVYRTSIQTSAQFTMSWTFMFCLSVCTRKPVNFKNTNATKRYTFCQQIFVFQEGLILGKVRVIYDHLPALYFCLQTVKKIDALNQNLFNVEFILLELPSSSSSIFHWNGSVVEEGNIVQ